MTTLADSIRTRCFWQISIRPDQFLERRIESFSRLRPIIRESSVSLRGWDFPHVDDRRESLVEGEDWVGEDFVWQNHHEVWRLFQSGMFLALIGLWYDWDGSSNENPTGNGASEIFPLWDSVYRATEIFEFAARLATSEAGAEYMHVDVKIGNMKGRRLYQDNSRKSMVRQREFIAEQFTFESGLIDRVALLANPRSWGARLTRELLARFDFDVPLDIVSAWQDELRR